MTALRPLILLGIILTASGLAAEQLGPIVGPVEYNGYLVFDYPEGENPITNIVFNVDPWVAECLIIVNVPSPWTYTYTDPVLTLSGGSLNPGGSVSVTVSLDDYFSEGSYQVASVGTTSAGEVSNAIGPLLVGDLYLLQVISLANTYQTPLIGSVIGLIALELMFWQRNRPFRELIPPIKEVNDFVRDSEKILNKEGTPKTKVPENKPDPDLEHKSVLPELAPYDGSVPIDRTKKDSSEPSQDLNDSNNSIPWNIAKATEVVAKVLEDSLGPETKSSDVASPDSNKPDLVDDENSVASDLADYELYKSPSDRAKELILEGNEGSSTDSVEYDNSDLPGLDDIPEPDTEYDDSDLPRLEKPETEPASPESEPTDRAWDSDLPDWVDNPPEIEPFPKNTEADLKELEEIRAREKKLPRLDPDEEVSG